MSILEIKNCFDPVLRKKCSKVENVDEELENLTQDMIETMYDASGVGLAGNQIGLPQQLIVVDLGFGSEKRDPNVILNPIITASEDEIRGEEGCLSIPDIVAEVTRAQKVEVKGVDLTGKDVRYEAEGFIARAFQHELDHLNGKLFWDYLGKMKRDILLRKFKKMLKENES
jgi:peptide deformylase